MGDVRKGRTFLKRRIGKGDLVPPHSVRRSKKTRKSEEERIPGACVAAQDREKVFHGDRRES